jgi:hypothetical protein
MSLYTSCDFGSELAVPGIGEPGSVVVAQGGKNVLDGPFAVGSRLPAGLVAEKLIKQRARFCSSQEGMELIESKRTRDEFVDRACGVDHLRKLAAALRQSGPDAGREIRDASLELKPLIDRIDTDAEAGHEFDHDPGSGREFDRVVRRLVKGIPKLTGSLNPYGIRTDVLTAVRPVIDIGLGLDQEASKGELERVTGDLIARARRQSDDVARDLVHEVHAQAETLASLSALSTSAGRALGRSTLFMTRDVNELLTSEHRHVLVNAICDLRGFPYLDLVFANFLYGSRNLHALADELLARRCVSIVATLGECTSEHDVSRLVEENPRLGKFSAANVFLFVGRGKHRGYEYPVSSSYLSWRLGADGRGAQGMLEPSWGPLSSKNLVGLEDCDTLSWRDESFVHLAMNAGINAVRQHDTGVRSFAFGRSRSLLEGQRFIDSNRLGLLFTGQASQWLENLIATSNTPAMQRAKCEWATKRLFEKFRDSEGFSVEIMPVPSRTLSSFEVVLVMKVLDQQETCVVRLRQSF